MNDLKFAVRQLLQHPGFALVAVLTLALGIGANTAIFSVVNAVLLRPLPYPEAERLVWLSERSPNFPTMSISYPNFSDWRDQQQVFEQIGVYNWGTFNLIGAGDPRRLSVVRISADAFTALRARAALGRLFTPDEDKPGAPSVVLLSHGLWQDRFGGQTNVLEQSLTLDGRPYTVMGVMPEGFAFPSQTDIWVPVGPFSDQENWRMRGNHPGLLGVARLKPGVTLEAARSGMDAIAARLEEQYPDSNKRCGVRIEPLLDNQVGDSRRALWTVLGAVGVVLMIACANVANLLLARAAARQKEMAVRTALGAGRWRIIRQLLTESLMLSVTGGLVGLLLAWAGVRLILAWGRDSIPRSAEIGLDTDVLMFTGFVAVLTGILFGLAPALQASRPDVEGVLKDTARGSTGGRARLRQGLVIAEVALTLVLLTAAGLMLRSFHRLQRVDSGYSHERVLTFRLDLPERVYDSPERQIQFFDELLGRLRTVPGVQSAAVSSQIPHDYTGWQTGYRIEGEPEPPPGEGPSMEVTVVSEDYFRVMGIQLLRGREFNNQDNREHLRDRDLSAMNRGQRHAAGLRSVIVDEEFARKHWPDRDPIGQRIRLPWGERDRQPALTVVGVVRRVKLNGLDEREGFVQAYLPFLESPGSGVACVLKTGLPPEALNSAVLRQIRELDPELPIYDNRPMSEMRNRALAGMRMNFSLLILFAGVALGLAVIGFYGVLAYTVTQRRREIGVRMALGAQRRNVLGLVIGHGMRLALAGVVLGLIGAVALTRLMRSLLFEVSPLDPMILAAVPLVLAGVALFACWLPARRAAQLDPMDALRCE